MSPPPVPPPPPWALLWVGAGGFLGAILRYLLGGWAQRLTPIASFPAGTLAVNVLGCLAIGLVAGVVELRHGPFGWSSGVRLFLLVGLLGGFTTFSSFAWETLELARTGGTTALGLAFANVALQVVLGLAAAWAGLGLTRLL